MPNHINEKDVHDVLRDQSLKLINLGKSNPMITTLKLGKTKMDLAPIGITYQTIMSGAGVEIANRDRGEEGASRFQNVVDVLQDVRRNQRESGANALYVAYPFVEGKIPGSDLNVRAPLMLVPVKMTRSVTSMTMRLDDSRDPVFNHSFVLAFLKYRQSDKPLVDCTAYDMDAQDLQTILKMYYSKYDIQLTFTTLDPTPFINRMAGDLNFEDAGTFTVTPYMVLGRFSNNLSSIQEDYRGIVADSDLPQTIINLMKGVGSDDFYSIDGTEAKEADIHEADLNYIHPLNGSQENIIDAVRREDVVVIQGPPGTGKSQVIAGIAVDSAIRGIKTLIVSEKRTPLDVIVARLADYDQNFLLIDDSSDKDKFYKQILEMVGTTPVRVPESSIEVANEIDASVEAISEVNRFLSDPMPVLNEPASNFFPRGNNYRFSDSESWKAYNSVKGVIDPVLMTLDYGTLVRIRDDLDDRSLRAVFEYHEMIESEPWLASMRTDLTERDVAEFGTLLTEAFESKGKQTQGIMSKFSKRVGFNAACKDLSKRFMVPGADASKLQGMSSAHIIEAYNKYCMNARIYAGLDDSHRAYADTIHAMSVDFSDVPEVRGRVLDIIVNEHLTDHMSRHPDVLSTMLSYRTRLSELDRRMAQRMEQTGEVFDAKCRNSAAGLAKIRGEVEYIANSAHPLSVAKFVSRYPEVFDNVMIWLMTPDSVSDVLPLKKGMFDLVVFDESSQIYAERAIPAIYRARKAVIAGDHMQLRPSSLGFARMTFEEDGDDFLDEVDIALEQESLLDLARMRYDTYLLNTHYRSESEELIAFSNSRFYGGKLDVSPNVTRSATPPIEYIKVEGVWKNQSNRVEAERAVSLLRSIMDTRQHAESIGIITFNSTQRDLIEDLIEREALQDPEFAKRIEAEYSRKTSDHDLSLFIKNIETVQGDERDIIIFSIGYAPGPDGRMMNRYGWLNQRGGENRLNVAISRARKKVIIVSSILPEQLDVDGVKNDGPRLLRDYLKYCKAVNDGDSEAVRLVLAQGYKAREPARAGYNTMVDDFRAVLEGSGYRVRINVGVGERSMDMAVYKQNRCLFGIEIDGGNHNPSGSVRDQYVHHSRYLAARGWTVFDSWSPNYWRDRDGEVSRLLDFAEAAAKS